MLCDWLTGSSTARGILEARKLGDLQSSSLRKSKSCPSFVQNSCDFDEGITALGLTCVAIADEVGLMC